MNSENEWRKLQRILPRCFILALCFLIDGRNLEATIIPPDIKNTVCFIFIANAKGEKVPNGTGFLVGVKAEKEPERTFGYLVTAKHVLKDENGNLYSSVFIRLNKKDNTAELIELKLAGQKICTHSDDTVDIAVIPAWPDEARYDFKVIPSELLMTKEIFDKEKITEGDEVFFVGLFTNYFGEQKNVPVTRFGRVAMITDEKINWDGKMTDLYLLETQSFGGNSGAPVFFYLNQTRQPGLLILGASKIFLAGVMQGTFLDAEKVRFVQTQNVPISVQNAGIAAVVPAYKLREILFGDELTEMRRKAEARTGENITVSPKV